uniref:HEAT repeat domain-containing protein n=1 Tax=Candidatus Methanogaster sp. ANME-2c ERB4 TaxID=2759911 RepID=A0A7G9XZK0_9EURY|nr:hypothetical protein JNOLDJLP_00008 [Methanosarcinales archaeon ANME-2c ERB4]QNO41588.1 hypothetical protein OAEIHDOC_00008 [Methanosarcinales archaeon ANME-2c ERB4]
MVDQVEIHRKVVSDDVKERREAVDQLRDNFVDLLDKKEAWEDLIRLTRDDYRWGVRCWHNIKHWLTLTWNEDSVVRWRAVDALGSAFQYVPDKDVAWEDLIRMTWNEDSVVRWNVAGVLGSAFQYVSDKDKAWEDLIRMTGEEDGDVRVFANYSLGRVSIFKATEAESEKDFRKYLKDSVEFFGKTKQQHVVNNMWSTTCGVSKG